MPIRQPAAERLVRQLLELRLYRLAPLSEAFVAAMAKIVVAHVSIDEQKERSEAPPSHSGHVVSDELLEALIDVCRVLSEHPDSMTAEGPLHVAFINAVAVVQAHTPPPPPLLNATEHSMDLPNG